MTTRTATAKKPKLALVPELPESNPRRRRRRRNPGESAEPQDNPRRRRRRRNPEETTVEDNPRRRRRGKRRRRNNPRKKNMKGSTVALIAVGVLIGVPAVIIGGMALMGRNLLKKAQETGPIVIPAQPY